VSQTDDGQSTESDLMQVSSISVNVSHGKALAAYTGKMPAEMLQQAVQKKTCLKHSQLNFFMTPKMAQVMAFGMDDDKIEGAVSKAVGSCY